MDSSVVLAGEAARLWKDPDFSIAFWGIRWYAIFFMLGFLIALMIGCFWCRKHYKIPYDCFYYYGLILVPTALFGARFWSACIGDLQWSNFFNFRHSGGLAIQGGVIFSLIAAFIFFPLILKKPKYHVRVEEGDKVYILKPSMWVMLDIGLPLVLIGQAIGRWGNFFNGELFGADLGPAGPNDPLQWLHTLMPGVYERMKATSTGIGEGVVNGNIYQPLFLYESMLNILTFSIIYFVLPNIKQIKAGVVGSLYLVDYGIIRFCMEPLRNHAFSFLGTYILNGIMLAAGVILIILAQWVCPRYRKKQLLYHAYCVCMRLPFIKMLVAFKTKRGTEILHIDPELKQFGFNKKPSFERNDEEMLYYGPQDYDKVEYYNIEEN